VRNRFRAVVRNTESKSHLKFDTWRPIKSKLHSLLIMIGDTDDDGIIEDP
jgi:hypothetical protein